MKVFGNITFKRKNSQKHESFREYLQNKTTPYILYIGIIQISHLFRYLLPPEPHR